MSAGRVEELDLIFHSAMARFFAIPTRQPASGDVTFAQIRVLWAMDISASPLTPGEAARQLGISPSTATELVDRLERRDFLRRMPSRDDRRRTVLELRPRGRAFLAEFARRRRERFRRLGTTLSRAEMDRLLKALRTVDVLFGKWGNGRA